MDSNGLLPELCGQPSASHALADVTMPGAPSPVHDSPAPSASESPHLLIIEDDVPLARLLGSWLHCEGFATELAHDGEQALERIASDRYSLILLDLNLPKMDGLTLLGQLRAEQMGVPVLVLTGRNRTEDMVLTLNQGADDCLLKPFSLLELLARIRAVLRRKDAAAPVLPAADRGLSLHREEYRVVRNGRKIDLTPREFALLEYLMEHSPKPVSRAKLMEDVWRVPFDPNTNIVDVYMKYLRDKIDVAGDQKSIRTVRGVGYALACA